MVSLAVGYGLAGGVVVWAASGGATALAPVGVAGCGGDAVPGPRVTPPVEMYSVEHAITTGEVPFAPLVTQPAPSASAAASYASVP